MKLKLDVDISQIASEFDELRGQVELALYQGVQALAAQTRAKVAELAQDGLKSTRDTYLNALDFQEVEKGVWVVSLNESAMFIENGMEPHSMVDNLLRKNAKVSKDGGRYKVIPFHHSKESSQQTTQEQDLVNQIRGQLKKQNIPFRKIEKDAGGKPRIGKLHQLDIPTRKLKPSHTSGPLDRVTIYQTQTPGGKVRRDILTFRTVSDKHKNEGKWFHPGVKAKNFMDQAFEWSEKVWTNEILPSILSRFR